jgi:hypothetical protein
MTNVNLEFNNQDHQQKQSQFGFCDSKKTAKITMSAAGKNQNTNSGRWAKKIQQYHDILISH